MKKLFVTVFVILLVSSTNLLGQGGKPPKGDSDVPATTTINDSDAGGSFFRIQSDGLGSYLNGVDSVESIIQGIGDWEMDTKTSPVRRVFIDFGDPVIPGDSTAPFAAALVPTRFISKCASLGFKIRDMALGETRLCPLATSIDYGGNTYRIAMNPAEHPTTEYIQWTCLTVSSGRCSAWEMVPSVIQADGQRKARGRLIKVGTSRKNPDQLLGEFYFAFKINVTTP